MRTSLQPGNPNARRRPALSGVSLLVLVAFALGASVSRADASLFRPDGATGRTALVESTIQHRVSRPQRKQHERPSAQAVPARRVADRFGRTALAPTPVRTPNLPCLRESLVALPPPGVAV